MIKEMLIGDVLWKYDAQNFVNPQTNEDGNGYSKNKMVYPVFFSGLIIPVNNNYDVSTDGKEQV